MKKIKIFLPLLVLFVALLFTMSCDRDVDVVKQEVQNINYHISRISIGEIRANRAVESALERVTKFIEHSKVLRDTLYSNTYGFTIDTDYASYIEDDQGIYHSYTFAITRDTATPLLENLLLSLQEDGSYKSYLVSYTVTEEERVLISNGIEVDLEGKITFTEIEDSNLIGSILQRPLDCGVYTDFQCWFQPCGFIYADGSVCTNTDHETTVCGSVVLYNDDCDGTYGGGGSGSGGNGGTPTGSGGNGGVPTPNPSNHPTDVSTPTLTALESYILQLKVEIRHCLSAYILDIGDTTVNAWLDNTDFGDPNNFINLKRLNSFLNTPIDNGLNAPTGETNCSSPQAQAFAVFATQALNESFHSTTFSELLEVLDFEQDYRQRMSQAELAIFDYINRNKQLKYLQSAYNAESLMNRLFPNTVSNPCSIHNGQGDAFRHALWNALSTVRLGETLTEQLTSAHEIHPVPNGYTQEQFNKEKEMDLYNNSKGRVIAYGSGLIWQLVKNAKDNGELKYLSNLQSNCLPSSNSNLIPTN